MTLVMPGLVPGIHDPSLDPNVDGRDKPGHDEAKDYRLRFSRSVRRIGVPGRSNASRNPLTR